MDVAALYVWIEKHERRIRLFMIPILIFLVAGVYALVYATGGIKYVYSHSMYVPILLSGIMFGKRGGILIGLLAGIVLGPMMPIDVITGEPQETINWLYRTGFFTLIGFLTGLASDSVRAYLRHIRWLSRHDISSNLLNRYALIEQLEKISTGSTNAPNTYILALVSIENESELLSTFGVGVIDDAINQLVSRLNMPKSLSTSIFRTNTAQIGVLTNDTSSMKTESFFDELTVAFRNPILFEEIPIHIDVRVGYVSLTEFQVPPELYLQKAGIALSEACNKARDHMSYSPAISIASRENLVMLGELQNALIGEQLSLHYQPKVTISTGAIHGVEALMRWNHPARGNIAPGIFIPRAEESTLINQITDFALVQAMAQMVLWRQSGLNIRVAVNISARNLMQSGFTRKIFHFLEHHALNGDELELEITEGALMLDPQRAISKLSRLSDAKITISIDDFGTGYSSLQYLHQLPVSLIKIDQSFVRELPSNKSAISIVEAAVSMAHKMNIMAIAEGVENREAYDFLKNIGCDMAQGYMISRPLPATDYTEWHMQNNGCFV